MKSVYCEVPHNPTAGLYGDCVSAAIATVLELGPNVVPNFWDGGPDNKTAWSHVRKFLRARSLDYTLFALDPDKGLTSILAMAWNIFPNMNLILMGQTASGNNHAVIIRNGEVKHNPSRFPLPLVGPCSDAVGNREWQILLLIPSIVVEQW